MNKYHDYPYEIYNEDYFDYDKKFKSNRSQYVSAKHYNTIKIQDEFAALCYMYDAASNYLEVEKLLGIPYQSLNFIGSSTKQRQDWLNMAKGIGKPLKLPWRPLYDTVYNINWTILDLINIVNKNKKCSPSGVIDFGGGLGKLSSCISHLNTLVAYIDPYPGGFVKDEILNQENIISYQWINELGSEIKKYDTLVFCASIEHIPESYIFEILKLCKGMKLIITNTITFHPIHLDGKEHITRIDDKFYNKLENNINETIYRQGSHFIGII